jgi:hypothetical protein
MWIASYGIAESYIFHGPGVTLCERRRWHSTTGKSHQRDDPASSGCEDTPEKANAKDEYQDIPLRGTYDQHRNNKPLMPAMCSVHPSVQVAMQCPRQRYVSPGQNLEQEHGRARPSICDRTGTVPLYKSLVKDSFTSFANSSTASSIFSLASCLTCRNSSAMRSNSLSSFGRWRPWPLEMIEV